MLRHSMIVSRMNGGNLGYRDHARVSIGAGARVGREPLHHPELFELDAAEHLGAPAASASSSAPSSSVPFAAVLRRR